CSDHAVDVESGIAYGPHHRPVDARVVPAQHLERPHWDAAKRHFEPGHAAPGRRDADAAAAVGAGAERHLPGADRRRRAAAGAAGRALWVPRIAGDPKE